MRHKESYAALQVRRKDPPAIRWWFLFMHFPWKTGPKRTHDGAARPEPVHSVVYDRIVTQNQDTIITVTVAAISIDHLM